MPIDDAFDLQDFLPYLLNQSAEACGLGFQKIYKGRYGILRSEWRVLFHLGRYGDMTAKEIVERAKTHKTKISRAVKALEDKRYLKREKDEGDRRLEHLTLTPAGAKVYRDLVEEARRYDAALLARLSAEEAAALRRALLTLSS
ncbi:MarR family transcriptional regulator [Pseudoruegeria sp. SHC-113]|uniref:MarR family transcriptional regulator n=1 Tax=Pseudoruegeria sp. SHC-113 TaxID=2855439 RepID=UPI0021BB5DEE|nr:MarR family transcriptional regulator [Pseudoruegeria sp. SHC-113]MCT8161125.1 MarR family transcriptional regulator [Pseudoruegeria sp. SHC-113]